MRIKLFRDPAFGSLSIILYEEQDGKKFVAEHVDFTLKELDQEKDDPQPTIKLHGNKARQFLQDLAEDLNRYGVRTDSDAKLQGTLDATRFHLEDLRTLLKLKI